MPPKSAFPWPSRSGRGRGGAVSCRPAFRALTLFSLFSPLQDAFVELYGPNMRPLFDFSWLSLKALLSLALVGACISLGAYLGHK